MSNANDIAWRMHIIYMYIYICTLNDAVVFISCIYMWRFSWIISWMAVRRNILSHFKPYRIGTAHITIGESNWYWYRMSIMSEVNRSEWIYVYIYSESSNCHASLYWAPHKVGGLDLPNSRIIAARYYVLPGWIEI